MERGQVEGQPGAADNRGEHRAPGRVLGRVARIQAQVRGRFPGPGQQVEDQRDRGQALRYADQLQGEVEPGAAGGKRPDQQRLLVPQGLRRGQRSDQVEQRVQAAGAERDGKDYENFPADQSPGRQAKAGFFPQSHVRTLAGGRECPASAVPRASAVARQAGRAKNADETGEVSGWATSATATAISSAPARPGSSNRAGLRRRRGRPEPPSQREARRGAPGRQAAGPKRWADPKRATGPKRTAARQRTAAAQFARAAGRRPAGRQRPGYRLGAGVVPAAACRPPVPDRDRIPFQLPGGRRFRLPARGPGAGGGAVVTGGYPRYSPSSPGAGRPAEPELASVTRAIASTDWPNGGRTITRSARRTTGTTRRS